MGRGRVPSEFYCKHCHKVVYSEYGHKPFFDYMCPRCNEQYDERDFVITPLEQDEDEEKD